MGVQQPTFLLPFQVSSQKGEWRASTVLK